MNTRVNITLMDDVRDPGKWNAFIRKIRQRARDIASNCRSRLGLQLDLGVVDPALPDLQKLHAALYKLARVAVKEQETLNRKEIVNVFNCLIHGPKVLKDEAMKILNRMEG
jgi:hypothetical protein